MDEIGSRGWEKGGSGKTLDFSMSKSATSSVHDFCIFEDKVWFQYRPKKIARGFCTMNVNSVCLECYPALFTGVHQFTAAAVA